MAERHACDAPMLLANDDILHRILWRPTKTTTTIATMKQAIHDMKSNVEKYRTGRSGPGPGDQLRHRPMVAAVHHLYLATAWAWLTACRRSCRRARSRNEQERGAI